MLKNLSLLTLFLFTFSTSLSQAEGPNPALKIKVTSMKVMDEAPEGIENFKGSLSQLQKEYIDDENTTVEITYEVKYAKDHLKNAKRVALYAWKYLTESLTTRPPFPCGYYREGKLTFTKGFTQKGVSEYSITGTGNGGNNSCTGVGGPGHWDTEITVKHNRRTHKGTIHFYTGSE